MNDTAASEARATELTALLHNAPAPTDHEAVSAFLHRLCDAGLAVMLCYPGTKKPFDGRTVQARSAADKAARDEAKAAGRRNWESIKSPSGLALATTDPAVLDGYLAQYAKVFNTAGEPVAINLAIEVGGSGLVVVDADTPTQVCAFVAANGAPDAAAVPTVSTPGSEVGGEMVHHDGGHYYFTLTDAQREALPRNIGAFTCDDEDGFAVLWDRRYVLIPPSVRKEGGYKAVGACAPAPGWLLEQIGEHGRDRAQRAQHSAGQAAYNGPVAQWGSSVSWAEILTDTDWVPLGRPDNCGCETWTAPGPHGSAKSATAHEPGCVVFDSADPPLKIWTDHDIAPFTEAVAAHGQAVTRLRAVAAIHYDNDMGAAMEDLGLQDEPVTLSPGQRDEASEDSAGQRGLRITWASEIEPAPVPWLWVDISESMAAHRTADPFRADDVADVACVPAGQNWSAPDVETNGRIACGMVSIAAGREGSGKSSFGIWLTAKITRGTLPGAHYGQPRKVFYLATEDSWQHTLVPRLVAAGADMTKVAKIEVVVQEGSTVSLSLPLDTELLTREITKHQVALVVVDPLMSTLGAGLDANGSRDVRTALEPLAAMADRTKAAVVGIAHFNKSKGLDSLSRITGSGAFKDIARAVFVFADDGAERVFSQRKNSVGRYDLPSLTYTIRSEFVDTPTGRAPAGVFQFTGIADRTVDDVLDDERQRRRPKTPVQQFLIDYITKHADAVTGEVDAANVIAAGEDQQFSAKQITDARNRARNPEISTRKLGYGKDGRNLWKLGR